MSAHVTPKTSRVAVAELEFDFDDEPKFEIEVIEPEPPEGQPKEPAGVKAAIVRWLEQQA